MRRLDPSRRPVGPVMLETWGRGLSGPRSGRPLRPSGAAGSRAHLSASRVNGGVFGFKFVLASRSESLRFRVFGPLALHRVGSRRHGLPGRARNGLSLA